VIAHRGGPAEVVDGPVGQPGRKGGRRPRAVAPGGRRQRRSGAGQEDVGPGVAVAGLAGAAQVAEGAAGGVQRSGQAIAIIGDGRAGPGQGLQEGAGRFQLGQR
jgi:hypothetical protein